ncbi:MAG: putative Co/Zn/Cd efflux system membrane fusion protein [Ignavibacteriae bacterium]|nr:MAG: putative Co/Zn/Cd efflux system membrane fusion protein [Ignavibacteriota bacterium]
MKLKLIIILTIMFLIIPIIFNACNNKKNDRNEIQILDEQTNEIYTCPMHPSVVSDRAGACPVCGMALVKQTNRKNASVEDLAMLQSISLSPTQRVIANVATETVKIQTINRKINTVGIVDFAEPNLATVTARFSGRIEKVHVDYTGKLVSKNQPLFEIYSPALISAQKEFLLAVKNSQDAMIEASLDRLQYYFGLSEQQISDLKKNQKALYTIAFHSPISGTVISKEIQEGQYVDEGMILYKLADLSKVWVYLEVYEKDIQFVKVGSEVQLTTESYPNESFVGKVTFIEPVVNSETRTVRVRTEFNNSTGKLKPQMYVTAQILTQSKNTIVIPSPAVIYTGKRKVVWVEVKENTFEPRDVIIGIETDNLNEIISGLNVGDKVVVTGGYLLDSESQLKYSGSTGGHNVHSVNVEKNITSHLNTKLSKEVTVIVDGGYSPSTIYAKKGQKLTINFERHDNVKCTDEVLFPDFKIKKYLTPHQTTVIEITPMRAGEFRFHCGMDMLEGKVIVYE